MTQSSRKFSRPQWLMITLAGFAILAVNMGIRQSMGLLLPDMSESLSWSVPTLTFGLALQNLVWGLAAPIAGLSAERFGVLKTLLAGTFLYGGGLLLLSLVGPTDGLLYQLSNGLIIAIGIGATTYPVVLAAVGKHVSQAKRSLALGIASAGGSMGQLVYALITQFLVSSNGWSTTLVVLALSCLLIIPFALVISRSTGARAPSGPLPEAATAAGRLPLLLLSLSFFVCGFHVAYISVHLPLYLATCGLAVEVAGNSLAIIGALNIAGTVLAGWLGGRFNKIGLLIGIYTLRAAIIMLFVAGNQSPYEVYWFSAAMGVLWLSTVPLTSGVIADIYGYEKVASHFGVAMFAHQVGAFFGIWATSVFLLTYSYEATWGLSIALGFIAGMLLLPMLLSDRQSGRGSTSRGLLVH